MICRLIVGGWRELLILLTATTASTLLGANRWRHSLIHSWKRHLNEFPSRLESSFGTTVGCVNDCCTRDNNFERNLKLLACYLPHNNSRIDWPIILTLSKLNYQFKRDERGRNGKSNET